MQLFQRASKIRRYLTKIRSGTWSNEDRMTHRGPYFYERCLQRPWSDTLTPNFAVKMGKLLGFGPLHFELRAVEKSVCTFTRGP